AIGWGNCMGRIARPMPGPGNSPNVEGVADDVRVPKKKVRRPLKASPPHQRRIDVVHKPGLANDMLRELAPLLAEDGIDLTSGDFNLEQLQAALNRAAERRNLALFTPVGKARTLAVAVIQSAVTFLLADEPHEALATLELAVPESSDDSQAEVSSCI